MLLQRGMNCIMPDGAIKSGPFSALAAAMALCGANEASATTFQIDRLAFERIHQPTEQQASHGWMVRMSVVPADEGAGWDAPRSSRPPMTHEFGAWQLAGLGPLARSQPKPSKAGAEIQLVRLRPSTGNSFRGMRSIDAHVFEATPGGRSISDTYDFAGLDPDVFAKIKPVKTKNLPDEMDKPPSRKLTPRPRANEVLELGSKTSVISS